MTPALWFTSATVPALALFVIAPPVGAGCIAATLTFAALFRKG